MCHESKPERQLLVAARKPRPDKMLEEEKKQKKQKKHNSIAFRHFGLQKHTAIADTADTQQTHVTKIHEVYKVHPPTAIDRSEESCTSSPGQNTMNTDNYKRN